jgi:hypothetical protein
MRNVFFVREIRLVFHGYEQSDIFGEVDSNWEQQKLDKNLFLII